MHAFVWPHTDIANLLSREVETTERLDSNLLGHLKTRQGGVGKERGPVEGASNEGDQGDIPSRLQVGQLPFIPFQSHLVSSCVEKVCLWQDYLVFIT